MYSWGPCVGVRWAMALIGDTKQAMGEGKSGPVENRTNRTSSYGLYHNSDTSDTKDTLTSSDKVWY